MKTIILLFIFSSGIYAGLIDSIKVEVLAKSSESWDGNLLPAYPTEKPEITIIKVTVPPNEKLELHKHTIINAGIMIKGELTVITETQDTLHLHAGEPIIEVVNKYHYGINTGEIPAEIVVFYAGTINSQLSVKKK